ncbi:Activating signal cointegrator 1 complex subunit 3 [Intoshia linei]|uniref:U5 small nuclear ribonucleoprotein 200 kDa helicase n=1 Tax=Intoshia linei TaxID=1819745 RepID=A0A177BCL0_9BILA|nr:Activating signal cointegrator 1 complex subunit 3 [Intoshia linei]
MYDWKKFYRLIATKNSVNDETLAKLYGLIKKYIDDQNSNNVDKIDSMSESIEQAVMSIFVLLVESNNPKRQHVSTINRMFGLELNWEKLDLIFEMVFEMQLCMDSECKEKLLRGEFTLSSNGDDDFYIDDEEDFGIYRNLPDYFYDVSKFQDHKVLKKSERITFMNHVNLFMAGTWISSKLKDHTSEISVHLSNDEMGSIIFDKFISNDSNNTIQNDLVDLLGFDCLDLIEILLDNRDFVIMRSKMHETDIDLKKLKSTLPPDKYYKCIVLHSAILRENKNKAKITKCVQIPIEVLTEYVKYPNVYDSFQTAVSFGKRKALPSNTRYTKTAEYESIMVPETERSKLNLDISPIHVQGLDKIGQTVFTNINKFNLVQSIVFPIAYNHDDNLLVAAPTGAGKTNIALMTIVRTIKKFTENGEIDINKFKIVYIAPMKALATEITRKLAVPLKSLGVNVKEYTGDMRLTKTEIKNTQIFVSTPEKWDIITRKNNNEVPLSDILALLILDEIHLLNDERGSVIESIVARTLRQVVTSQKQIRLVGLSATLPNYLDIAAFLKVDYFKGLFYFDERFRPVPLNKTFIGVRSTFSNNCRIAMNQICTEKAAEILERDEQIIVFVHSRNETVNTANFILEELERNHVGIYHKLHAHTKHISYRLKNSSNEDIKNLCHSGILFHNASLLREDRLVVENEFKKGSIRLLVSTATLAWGVNLPCHAVIIKGTFIYDVDKSKYVDISQLDVTQIFGRAGRPQFDTYGEAFIITEHAKMQNYVDMLLSSTPIESRFLTRLNENLNAEIVLGTITKVEEAIEWMQYTFMSIRMKQNPHYYGIKHVDVSEKDVLENEMRNMILVACKYLDKAQMIRFKVKPGFLCSTEIGQIAAHHYLSCDTVVHFNKQLKPKMDDLSIILLISGSSEMLQLNPRFEEQEELFSLNNRVSYPIQLETSTESDIPRNKNNRPSRRLKKSKTIIDNATMKSGILLQVYLEHLHVGIPSLSSDLRYINKNVSRIVGALFKLVLYRGYAYMVDKILKFCKTFQYKWWYFHHPLYQFPKVLSDRIVYNLERYRLSVDKIKEMMPSEIGNIIKSNPMGATVKSLACCLPKLDIEVVVKPVSSTILRILLFIKPDFVWSRYHNKNGESFIVYIVDPLTLQIYHYEYIHFNHKMMDREEPTQLNFCIPIFTPYPTQYFVYCASENWICDDTIVPINISNLMLPTQYEEHTELLDLNPLPIESLGNLHYQNIYNFTHFNPIQTQFFFCLYHTDKNVLVGAPTGSGKTVAAELAVLNLFNTDFSNSETKRPLSVYIAPLKALVRERFQNWRERIGKNLGKNVIELTGDVSQDSFTINRADVIITTPEKWDGITRGWKTRSYVRRVKLIIIDEIHLLGEERGPVIEFIVSRANYIASQLSTSVRIVGLSTALSNAKDLANWLQISDFGLYNFRPSVRPIPLEVHIQGFPGRHYCPRMATMNRPCYRAIETHSPNKSVIVFVSSRRQTRITAFDLIAYVASEKNSKKWVKMDEQEKQNITSTISNNDLKQTIIWGVGLHHAGLCDSDRKTTERLFLERKIQILIATSTLAWGINMPCHLVIIKGTEFYDGKTHTYVDFPITDVLQMIGRAGRPQFDERGYAVIMVQDLKKDFYKKFLYLPFPVESSVPSVLEDHLNAEIASSSITNYDEALKYLTMTFFYQRLLQNPGYYGAKSKKTTEVHAYICTLIIKKINMLIESGCVQTVSLQDKSFDNNFPVPGTKIDKTKTLTSLFNVCGQTKLKCTELGRIACVYYISHITVSFFNKSLSSESSIKSLLKILCYADEFSLMPIRHNEEILNKNLSDNVRYPILESECDSPYAKTFLLIQSHFSDLSFEVSDYKTDLKSVLDQIHRILQALMDICSLKQFAGTFINLCFISQMIITGQWIDDPQCFQIDKTRKLSKQTELVSVLKTMDKNSVDYINRYFDHIPNHLKNSAIKFVNTIPRLNVEVYLAHKRLNLNQVNIISFNNDVIITIKMKYLTIVKSNDKKMIFLALVEPVTDLLICTKRVMFKNENRVERMTVKIPNQMYMDRNVSLNLNILHNNFIGLDQMYSINLKF